MKRPKHNGSHLQKQRIRLRIRRQYLDDDASVLEAFAGEGRIYRGCWAGLRGVCIDIAKNKASAAARERPRWACYAADSEKALAAGLGSQPHDVCDLDAFGAPWKFAKAYLQSRRQFAPVTHLVMTDGYLRQRGRVPDRCLFPDAEEKGAVSLSVGAYLELAEQRLASWLPHGMTAEWVDVVLPKSMALYHVILRAEGAA